MDQKREKRDADFVSHSHAFFFLEEVSLKKRRVLLTINTFSITL